MSSNNHETNNDLKITGLDEYDERFEKNLPIIDRNTIILLGVQDVGKTSIVLSYFEQKKIDDIKSVRPTVFQDLKKRRPIWSVNKTFRIFDLGGQKQFRMQHVLMEEMFIGALAILFVIDAQGTIEKLKESLDYFDKIVKILKKVSAKNRPKIFVLSHKNDKKSDKVFISLEEIKDGIANLSIPIESFYETNIFDETVHEALTDIFFRLLIPDVILQVFEYVDFEKICKKIIEEDKTKCDKALFTQGRLWALKVRESWTRQQLGLEKLPSPDNAKKVSESMILSNLGGNFILKIPKSVIPNKISPPMMISFLQGISETLSIGKISLLSEKNDVIEIEIFRNK